MDKAIFSNIINGIQILGSPDRNSKDAIIAAILIRAPNFIKAVEKLRKNEKIDVLDAGETNVEAIMNYALNYPSLYPEVKELTQSLQLANEWVMPVCILISTNRLIVPVDDAFTIYKNIRQSNSSKSGNLVDALSTINPFYSDGNEHDLVISVKYKSSIRSLIDYIKVHQEELNEQMEMLPSQPKSRIEDSAIFWGHLAWVLRTGKNPTSWEKIIEYFDLVSENSSNLPVPPSDKDILRSYYRSFFQSVSRMGDSK